MLKSNFMSAVSQTHKGASIEISATHAISISKRLLTVA